MLNCLLWRGLDKQAEILIVFELSQSLGLVQEFEAYDFSKEV
jgi:hypothetical protein